MINFEPIRSYNFEFIVIDADEEVSKQIAWSTEGLERKGNELWITSRVFIDFVPSLIREGVNKFAQFLHSTIDAKINYNDIQGNYSFSELYTLSIKDQYVEKVDYNTSDIIRMITVCDVVSRHVSR